MQRSMEKKPRQTRKRSSIPPKAGAALVCSSSGWSHCSHHQTDPNPARKLWALGCSTSREIVKIPLVSSLFGEFTVKQKDPPSPAALLGSLTSWLPALFSFTTPVNSPSANNSFNESSADNFISTFVHTSTVRMEPATTQSFTPSF